MVKLRNGRGGEIKKKSQSLHQGRSCDLRNPGCSLLNEVSHVHKTAAMHTKCSSHRKARTFDFDFAVSLSGKTLWGKKKIGFNVFQWFTALCPPLFLDLFAPWVLEEEGGGRRSAGISTEVEKTAKKKICGAATDLGLMLHTSHLLL